MGKQYIIFNPLSNNGRGEIQARALSEKLGGADLEFKDITKIADYSDFLSDVTEDDRLVICGGDGTLNRFINDTATLKLPASVYYYPTGSGNDFAKDIGITPESEPVCIDKYLCGLPHVYVNGMDRIFINGIGYGVDGYCCEVGDKLRQTSDKPVNYTSIAIKGLLFHYKRSDATVTADGVTKHFKNVWIAPTMHGRYYGGGMMPTPKQDRLNGKGKLSLMVMHGAGKLKTLMVFPSIFKGEHVAHTKMVEVIEGKDITVSFERPTALQIDGETVLGVTEYRVTCPAAVENKKEEIAYS